MIVTYIFGEATDMIISGGSAGGLATYNWANYIASVLKPTAKVVALPVCIYLITKIFLKLLKYRTLDSSLIIKMLKLRLTITDLNSKTSCN